MRPLRLIGIGALGISAAACQEPAGDINNAAGSVIIGLSSDLVPGVDIARLRVIERAEGRAERDYILAANGAPNPLVFPHELRWDDLPEGARVDVELQVFKGYFSDEKPLIVRSASTRAVAGRALLLRARIERECIPSLRLTGDTFAPSCELPETCVAATCVDPYVPPAALEDYAPTWAEIFTDACKPDGVAEPVVVIGGGQAAFEPLGEGSITQVEGGPQGGFHVWISVRMKNLHQAGAKTFVDIYEKDAAEPMATFLAAQGYTPAESGYCELLGVRCQITHQSTMDIQGILGKTLRVTAKVSDPTGDVGVSEQLITLSDNVIKE